MSRFETWGRQHRPLARRRQAEGLVRWCMHELEGWHGDGDAELEVVLACGEGVGEFVGEEDAANSESDRRCRVER